ncbi:apolipoprotein N-acyltransferase [Armatimonas rosea]|uniref:Apolipoprotein N-acyltransferase n=1 Tax=Armatimonas rosea TaxID=685828 RepID=A0A7W9W9U3_ARMRO|nr:apolipoprotein N-acyltransferase [Armatimonas rosea]MBB6052907.1 apolipoprotein N-acyltransferase [Armatimonas rosea]
MKATGLALLAGILLALAFPPLSLWPLAWVAPGLLYTLSSTRRSATLAGYLFGVALFLLGAEWVRVLAVPLWLLLPLFPGALFALYGLVNGLSLPRCLPALRPLVFALLWALFEWLRGLGTYAVPWFTLASAHAAPSAIPLATSVTWLGAPCLGFLIAFTSATLAEGALQRRGRFALVLLIPIALALIPRPTPHRQRFLHLALIQAGRADSNAYETYLALSRKAARSHPDLIVWPEGAATELGTTRLCALARELGIPLLVGLYEDGPDQRPTNLALLIDGEGRELGRYAKRRLAPFGEVYPFQRWIPGVYAAFGIHHESFRHGTAPGVFTLPSGQRIGVGICFESAFPWVASQSTKAGAQLLLFLTSDQSFGQSAELAQHRDQAILRAMENQRPVAQVATTGLTTLIRSDGKVVAALAPGTPGILSVRAILPE